MERKIQYSKFIHGSNVARSRKTDSGQVGRAFRTALYMPQPFLSLILDGSLLSHRLLIFPYTSSSTVGEVLCRRNEGPIFAPVSTIILFIESPFNASSLLKVGINNLGNESLIRTMPFHFIFFYFTFPHWCN